MFENPFVLLCMVGLCWPGPIPLVILVYVLNRWSLQVSIAPKGNGSHSPGPERSHLSDEV